MHKMQIGFVLALFVLAVLVGVAAVGDESAVASVTSDELGSVHVNSSSGDQPVFLNGVDVVSELQQQRAVVEEQAQQIAELNSLAQVQASHITALQEQVCALDSPTTSFIPGAGTSTGQWQGGVLAPNGLIYALPGNADNVLVINPANSTTSNIVIPGANGQVWHGGAVANNGKVFVMPHLGNSVLVLDTATNTIDTTTLVLSETTDFPYIGAVVAHSGKLYAVPFSAPNVLILDPGC